MHENHFMITVLANESFVLDWNYNGN